MIQLRPTIESVRPQLEALLASTSALPARAALAGRQLLDRMSSPIRVAILGHPGSGKSQLLNLIAGDRLLPTGASLPHVEVCFGKRNRLTLFSRDGGQAEGELAGLARYTSRDAELIRIEAPLPILSTLTLIEVAAGGSAEEERAGVAWAASRADVVIWCSQEFTAAEHWLWSAMPERLKDHGFLVLTKADEMVRAGTLDRRIAELDAIVAEEFHSLVPVATLQGLSALCAEDGPNREALEASGAETLISALLHHVEQGRRADLDAALMFLSRFGKGAAAVPHAPPQTVPMVEPQVQHAPVEVPVIPQAVVPETRVPPEAFTAPERHDTPRADTALASAVEMLRDCGQALELRIGDADADEDLLEGCAQAAQAVAELLEPLAEDGAGAVAELHEEALEVSETLVLLGLERTGTAAADAVTLLLQLRRDIACARAA